MICEIQTYGKEVLRRKTKKILQIDDSVKEIVSNMFETMYAAEGIGLAAPQVDESIRLFIVDLSPIDEGEKNRVFIYPVMYDYG